MVSVGTDISKGNIFRFENYWMEHEQFINVVAHGWSVPVQHSDKAKIITAKCKNLKKVLRVWQQQLSSLKVNISKVKLILNFLEVIEEYRDLSVGEWNFKTILSDQLVALLN